jgi:hypothetical protein
MIKLCVTLDTFYRLQAFTREGFKSESKVYEDHAVIEVSKEVLLQILKKMNTNDSIDDVIVREIKKYLNGLTGREG